MGDTAPALYTVEEAAKLLRIGRTKAYALTQEWRVTGGRSGLPVVDFGNVLRVPRAALEQMLGMDLAAASVEKSPAPVVDTPAEVVTLQMPSNEAPVSAPTDAPKRSRRTRASRSDDDQLDLFDAAS